MLERSAIEKILVANGVSPTAEDEKIKSILLAAQWVDDDVETALSVLRENSKHEVRHDTINHVFRSDSKLDAASVSKLLGVTLEADAFSSKQPSGGSQLLVTVRRWLTVLTIAVVITFMIFFAVYMHMNGHTLSTVTL